MSVLPGWNTYHACVYTIPEAADSPAECVVSIEMPGKRLRMPSRRTIQRVLTESAVETIGKTGETVFVTQIRVANSDAELFADSPPLQTLDTTVVDAAVIVTPFTAAA